MTSAAADVKNTLPGALSIVLGLLVFSVFLNYVDRGNLSIAAPMIKDELHLSAAQLGFLLSSFFWTYGTGVCGSDGIRPAGGGVLGFYCGTD